MRIDNLDRATVEALRAAAKRAGYSLQSHVRDILRAASRSGGADSPEVSASAKAGFDDVHELVPTRQYLAWAGTAPYRITITRSLVGEAAGWGALVEELVQVPDRDQEMLSVWSHVAGVAQPLPGGSREGALRHVMRWVATYAGIDGNLSAEVSHTLNDSSGHRSVEKRS